MGLVGARRQGGIVRRECLERLGLSVTKATEGFGGEPAGVVGTGEREVGGVGGDGDSVVEGVWVVSGDVAGSAGGL